jgi:hypothetical protein
VADDVTVNEPPTERELAVLRALERTKGSTGRRTTDEGTS